MFSVFDRLQRYWWSSVDSEGLDIPLTAVKQTNALGECPIHIAAWKGEPEDIAWLLDNGAEINQAGDFEMTPLHYAYMGGNPDNVAILIDRGANRFARCDRGMLANDGRSNDVKRPVVAPAERHKTSPGARVEHALGIGDAMKIAIELVDQLAGEDDFEVLPDATITTVQGWVFFYNTAEFLRTGRPEAMLAGNGGVFVDRKGSVRILSSAQPWESQIPDA